MTKFVAGQVRARRSCTGVHEGNAVFQMVRRARGRVLRNLLLAECANAASVTLLFAIILLIVGTGALAWWWLLVVATAAAVAALYRAARRTPSAYVTAQLLDHRLGYADSISTALHFSQHPDAASSDVRRCQIEYAERLSKPADLSKAVPYTLPRSVYPMAALLVLVSSLFALRYTATKALDLKTPLASLLQLDAPEEEQVEQASNRQSKPEPDAGMKPQPGDGPLESKGSRHDDRNAARNEAAENGSQSKDGKASSQSKSSQEGSGESGEQPQAPEGQSGENANQSPAAGQRSAESGRGEPKSGNQAEGTDAAASSSQSSSILNKMRDAMQNLLSRVKPQTSNQPASARQQQGQQNGQAQGQQTAAQNQAGDGGRSGDGGNSQQGQADRSADSRRSQGKAPGEGQSPGGSKEPGAGVGAEDGSKDLKEAEQLAAMGKISEILGKRAANISGEATVEVQSTNQELRTPYAQRQASGGEGGAEIARDEVPVALQAYVTQYFEQVRKKQKK